MKYTTGNYWLLFEHWRNGNTTSKVLATYTTSIYSDHQNLTYFWNAQKLNRWQARWSLYLLEFNVKLIHQPGSKMIQSNALSWWPDLILETDHNNENMTLLLNDLFLNLLDITLQEHMLNLGQVDDFLRKFSLTDPLFGSPNDWKLELVDGLNTSFYKDRNYIPENLTLWQGVVWILHDHEMAGHLGKAEMLVVVEWHYWWPELCTFVWNYVKGCDVCQQYKITRSPSHLSYMPILPSSSTWPFQPFASCSMDLITDLPPSQGFDSILVVVDHGLMKGVILLPCNKTITAEHMAELLLEHLYKWFRLPDEFISDRGPQFAAHAFQELLKLLNVTSKLSMAYHPQTDGATEQVNQEIKAIFCFSYPDKWANKLYLVEFTHNNQQHADRKHSPFELMLGESPKTIPITFKKTKYPSIEQQMHDLICDREEALAAHELRRIADRWKNTFAPFKKGDKVWLDTRNIKTTSNPKIGPWQEGPFEISNVLGSLTYRLNLLTFWRIHNVFHAVLLPTSKMKLMGQTFLNLLQNSFKEKKSMKSNQSLDIDEENEDINTS